MTCKIYMNMHIFTINKLQPFKRSTWRISAMTSTLLSMKWEASRACSAVNTPKSANPSCSFRAQSTLKTIRPCYHIKLLIVLFIRAGYSCCHIGFNLIKSLSLSNFAFTKILGPTPSISPTKYDQKHNNYFKGIMYSLS